MVKCENILASLYVTWKRSRLTSAQSSITGLYGVRHSPLLLLTLGSIDLNLISVRTNAIKMCVNIHVAYLFLPSVFQYGFMTK